MATDTTAAGGSPEELRLRLQGLQHDVEKSAGRVKTLALLAILLVALLILLLVALHLYRVFQYASVEKVEVTAVPGMSGTAKVAYKPTSTGKIEFVRENEGLVQTLTEHANDAMVSSQEESSYRWAGDPGEQIVIRVTSRSGLFLSTQDFKVASAGKSRF